MKRFHIGVLTLGFIMLSIVGQPQQARAQDLEELLEEVGEAYATGYITPFIEGFGTGMNSNLYSTASIPKIRLTFGFGLKAMAASMHEDDKMFSSLVEDIPLADYLPAGTPYSSGSGDIWMEGPTVFGSDETPGYLRAMVNGVTVYETETIEGLYESNYVPFAAPEAYVSIMNVRATIRYLPSIDLGDYGEITYMGYGLQYSADGLLPLLPVSLMGGFFTQKLEVGSILEARATSMFVSASKTFGILTAYTGLAIESSEMDVEYTFESDSGDIDVAFEVDGQQGSRMTLGGALNLGIKLNAEVAFGKLRTYSVGLMFGI